MSKVSLGDLTKDHLAKALTDSAGRSAETVYGGSDHALRQTLVALKSGTEMHDHESPEESTIQVLQGRVRLASSGGGAVASALSAVTGGSEDDLEAAAGELLLVPEGRHTVTALEDSVLLLTVAKVEAASYA